MIKILMSPQNLDLVYFSTLGVLLSTFVSFLPALHIYNIFGIILTIAFGLENFLNSMQLIAFSIGLIVGYVFFSTISATLLSPVDESLSYYILPSAQWLSQGRGIEAIILSSLGSLCALFVLALSAPLLLFIIPSLKAITSPHMFWILGSVIAYMILSEWPKGTSQSSNSWTNFIEGWKFLMVGILTFVLSGLLGFIVTSKTLVPLEFAFQGLTPVFIGLFALPWLITNVINIGKVPNQKIVNSVDFDYEILSKALLSGYLGGLFSAFVPIVTAGIGGLISSHATAQRDSRAFIFSFGACKAIYYVGSFLIFFIPGLNLVRGGLAWIIAPFTFSITLKEFTEFIGTMLYATGLAFMLLMPIIKIKLSIIKIYNIKTFSYFVIILTFGFIYFYFGIIGLFMTLVATGIGLLPVLFQARRMNLMGVLLLPVTINMAGYGDIVLKWLGLL